MGVDADGIACCFDGRTARMLDSHRRKGLGKPAAEIIGYLASRGVEGKESLELGSGVGGLTIELAKRGTSRALGMDLSPEMVRAANVLVAESKLQTPIRFTVGDGATSPLPMADIVVLDSVLCCYPDVGRLLENSVAACRQFYAISVPDDRRRVTRLLKPLLPLQRLVFRGKRFRFFIHPTSEVFGRVEGRGLTRVFESRIGLTWSVAVFETSR